MRKLGHETPRNPVASHGKPLAIVSLSDLAAIAGLEVERIKSSGAISLSFNRNRGSPGKGIKAQNPYENDEETKAKEEMAFVL